MYGLGEPEVAEGGEDDLVVTKAGTKEIAEFVMLSIEAAGCAVAPEATHTSDPALDPAM